MLYEMRTYRLKVGTVPQYLRLVEEGIVIQREHLGNLVGYFTSEIGTLNEVVHIWAYVDLLDRQRRREELAMDPRWQDFIPKIQALLETMESKILVPTKFSPLQ